jgi:predicted GNAT family N-acyltransferase
MFVELKFLLPRAGLAALSAQNFVGLADGISLPARDEVVVGVTQLFGDAEALCDSLNHSSEVTAKRRVFIIVSPELVDIGAGTAEPSPFAKRLLQISWEDGVILGLIGIVPAGAGHVSSLDEVIETSCLTFGVLRATVEKIVARLWFKLPPIGQAKTQRSVQAFTVSQITRPEQFKQSLTLRHLVYNALGYLDERVAASQLKVEMDGYDPSAIHFMVASRADPSRVSASMRIIMPGWQHLPRAAAFLQPSDYESWCEELAYDEDSPVFHKLLNRRCNNALPLLGCFDYFSSLTEQPRFRDMIMPQYSCELSRVVVHPDLRGHGILKLLMEQAISVSRRMGKRYLLLECAPFHADMYAKYGFIAIEDQGKRYYSRAQRLDTWAVAMYLDLIKASDEREAHGTQPPVNDYQLHVEGPRRSPCALTIRSRSLDSGAIQVRLAAPYQMPRRALERREFIAKGLHPSLSTLVQNAFNDLDGYLGVLLSEVFQRLPDAQVTLVDADKRELVIDEAQCLSTSGAPPLHEVISNWLEQKHVTA